MSEMVLIGLDGSNPLGFLAGLGVLNVLAEQGGVPSLAWRTGDWRAMVTDRRVADGDDLVATLAKDAATWKDDPCLALRYEKATTKRDGDPKKAKPAWDLKPPPGVFRSYLQNLVRDSDATRRRAVDLAAAFATETARDNNENTKPTALHFTAGQQEFLEMVNRLCAAVTANDLREAVFGPWRYERLLPVLGWDCSATRAYALRADDPSKAEKRGVPGADWLAFRGLSFIRVAPRGRQIATTGCSGGWKNGSFCWPLWDAALTKETVQVLVQTPQLTETREAERRARGISAVFTSAIRRSDQGGYGSFAPAVGT